MNSIIKKSFGIFVFFSGYYYFLSFFKKIIRGNDLTILMYHRIVQDKHDDSFDSLVKSSNESNFEKQMRYLSRNCNIITFDNLLDKEKKLKRNSVIITFDDGYRDNYLFAYPILKKYNLPATMSLTTGCLDNQEVFWWDKVAYLVNKTNAKSLSLKGLGSFSLANKRKAILKIQDKLKKMNESAKNYIVDEIEKELNINIPRQGLFLSWENVKEMSKNNISFGAHTVTHPILTKIDLDKVKDEIINSKVRIEKEINKKVFVFAYPNGEISDMSYNIDVILKEAGFSLALSTIYGSNNTKRELFRLKRIGIEYDDDFRLFRLKLLGVGKRLASLYLKLR